MPSGLNPWGPRSYALTVHKAQGSEYPVVVLPLSFENGRMLHRSLLSNGFCFHDRCNTVSSS